MRTKRAFAVFLSVCLILGGCARSGGQETGTQPAGSHAPQSPSGNVLATDPRQDAGRLAFQNTGSVRVTYSTNISAVRYVSSADQLPGNEALSGYDDAFFETRALILVYETVSSGSIKVDIESIALSEADAVVTLTHEAQGDATTPVMTTWLVWAEVDRGLELNWSVANPAVESGVHKS